MEVFMNYYYQLQKHKVFTSFYHYDDQKYKDYIDRCFGNYIINKSVMDGEYNPDNSDLYIKRLIREDKISDSSVVVVLVGPNTRRRKHVDWEIYAGLRNSINGCAGLVGILLPEIRLTVDKQYSLSDLPARLADNVVSGFADIYTWEVFTKDFQKVIDTAFINRITRRGKVDNSRMQMQRNLGWNE